MVALAVSGGLTLGQTALGTPVHAYGHGPARVLVVGCIHGTECAGLPVAQLLVASHSPGVWVIPNLNPDGYRRGTRQNGRGVDLNRNFPSEWRPIERRWDPEYSGPRPASEPETRMAMALIRRLRPRITIWFHQPQGIVRAWGRSVAAAQRYARLAGLPFRRIRWPVGTATNWQNQRLHETSFVVELPAGPLSPAAARRYTAAALRLAK